MNAIRRIKLPCIFIAISLLLISKSWADEVSDKDKKDIAKSFNDFVIKLDEANISIVEDIHPSAIHNMRAIMERRLSDLEVRNSSLPSIVGMPSDRQKISDIEFVVSALRFAFKQQPEDFKIYNRENIRIRGMIKDEDSVYIVYSIPANEIGFTEPATICLKQIDGKWKINSVMLMRTIDEIWKLSAKTPRAK